MGGSAWTNQLVDLIILAAQNTGFSGFFTYSPAPGAGNLTASITAVAGLDPYNNHYLANISSYGGNFAASLDTGFVTFYTGSLAGGWTPVATVTVSAGGVLFLTAGAGINLADPAEAGSTLKVDGLLTALAGLAVTGGTTTDTLLVTGVATFDSTIDAITSTIDVHNGNVNLNMASPPNYPTAGKTLAQTQACLDGLIGSMINRQLVA
jgi:hypothetical protein